jgi:outer membrane lipoprotein-sorting protein
MKRIFTTLSLFGLLAAFPAVGEAHFRPDQENQLKAVKTANSVAQKGKVTKASANAAVQLSAQELAKMLEQQVLSGEGVSMKFKIKNGENVTVVADVKTKKVRIETGSMTIVSDGQTVYNYQKRNNQLTIDALGKGRASALSNPKDLFLFATNYSAKLISAKNGSYVLALTPNAKVQSALTAAGGISQITFNLGVAKDKLNIKSASAASNGQNVETGALSVKTLKSMPASQFSFAAPKGARVIDLRE